MMTLREVRVWHWRERGKFRQLEMSCTDVAHYSTGAAREANVLRAQAAARNASFHLGCVQALNDVPELHDTTAEQDSNA